jgi:hypothetical protein
MGVAKNVIYNHIVLNKKSWFCGKKLTCL